MRTYERKTDEELIDAALVNDANALGELYSRYFTKVFHKCLSIVKDHDEAFDFAQEALMKSFDHLKTFRRESSFATWLYIITHRYCLGELRKRNKMPMKNETIDYQDENHVPDFSSQDTGTADSESIMNSLIDHLPEDEKELLLLKYEQGESIEALTSMLQLSSSAVKMRLKRSREKLNRLFNVAITLGLPAALSHL